MSSKVFTVYQHITPNMKSYIGITCYYLSQRWGRNGSGYKTQMFYKAIQKYGWDNIQHIIIAEGLSQQQAEKLEIDMIKYWDTTNPKNGYNLSHGGGLTWVGLHHSEETKEKIRQAHLGSKGLCGEDNPRYGTHLSQEQKDYLSIMNAGDKNHFYGRHHTPEVIEQLRELHRGKKSSEETKQKLSVLNSGKKNNMYGKTHTAEARKKISEAMKGRPSTMKGSNHPMARKIDQYTLDGTYIKTYDTIKEAEKSIPSKGVGVWQVCNGLQKTHHGYIWRYHEI